MELKGIWRITWEIHWCFLKGQLQESCKEIWGSHVLIFKSKSHKSIMMRHLTSVVRNLKAFLGFLYCWWHVKLVCYSCTAVPTSMPQTVHSTDSLSDHATAHARATTHALAVQPTDSLSVLQCPCYSDMCYCTCPCYSARATAHARAN
ncbi:hypothetical protein JCGZ_18145 [Jatropha curcas]|uniref:Uncharacterized protein n=1 Tax=Jatropha curcas TaxID=180498 RepID=A0A067K2Q0_JATCU|nr:hypothetical protein JCGZ_18145 [Jatropha curcas]